MEKNQRIRVILVVISLQHFSSYPHQMNVLHLEHGRQRFDQSRIRHKYQEVHRKAEDATHSRYSMAEVLLVCRRRSPTIETPCSH